MHEYRFPEDEIYIPEYCRKNGIKIMIDECLVNEIYAEIFEKSKDYWEVSQKRPYYQMRGKPVTQEQAFDIISRTDIFFKHINLSEYSLWNFNMNWFENDILGICGFVHPSGIVGTNDYMRNKYPDTDEFISEWTALLSVFPYLDLFIAISDWHEIPLKEWDKLLRNLKNNCDYKCIYDKEQ